MKLLAPKNNWDMKSGESWWPLVGTMQSSAGVHVSEETALALTAFSCGVRVISETIASLPCHLMERVDERTSKKATDHSLYRIVHDEPNPEQDSMQYFDCQLSWMVGWGDAFAEKEVFGRNVVATWPIHPSRIPTRNIRRNGYDVKEIEVGEPGEIVYWVNNDDGTATPIPASSMLHVPGPLSRNGITGRSLLGIGRDAIGIAQATNDHAGAFYRNGANPNMVIKSPKTVGPDAAKRLRQQWQEMFGGVKNHYKTLILEDNMEAIPFTMSPEVSQLILARQFGVTEISRLLRIPPHMLMDLTRATFSNIESQGLDLIIYSLMPWIVRWERAMQRQLLFEPEKAKYRFKFNVMGLLRGDQAARAAFYKAGFDMGVFSPNDIREYEDLNPVEGGDQRFVPANNLVPLTAIGEMAQAQIDKTKAETERAQRPDPAPVAPASTDDDSDDEVTTEDVADTVRKEFAPIAAMLAVIVERRDDQELTRRLLEEQITRSREIGERQTEQVRDALKAHAEEQIRLTREILGEHAPDWDEIAGKFGEMLPDAEEIATNAALAALAQSSANLPAMLEEHKADMLGAVQRITDEAKESRESDRAALVEAVKPDNEAIAAALAPVLTESLSETVKTGMEAGSEAVKAVVEGQHHVIQGLSDRIDAIQVHAPPEPQPVDTSVAEALALREAAVSLRESESDAREETRRAAALAVLTAALATRIGRLADWESKSLANAIEEPRKFQGWRKGFYGRFQKQFHEEIGVLSDSAAQIGVNLDLNWAADRWIGESIADLKPLDAAANDNHYDKLRESVTELRSRLWTDRPQSLAEAMVEHGIKLHAKGGDDVR